ncbi:MAG: hypothetical protein K940chlam7_00655 [Chlamydiae bacterium]|nr:hypothetical protein [Chlamydiota bacterium]
MPTLMSDRSQGKLIHVAKYHPSRKKVRLLFLRRQSSNRYIWFEDTDGKEVETEVSANTVEEAVRLAHRKWKNQSFRTIICGFRYTLPERDEHGSNALFHQMVVSYSSPTGTYFDEELGHLCHVQNASQEALDLWKTTVL